MRKYPIIRGEGRGLNSKGVILMVLAFTFLIPLSLFGGTAVAASTSTVNVTRNSGWEKGDNHFWKESITKEIGGYVSYEVVTSNVKFGSYALHVLMDSRDLGLSEGYTTQSFMDSQSAHIFGYLDSNTTLDYWVYPDYDDNGTHKNPSARWEVALYFSTGNRLHYYCHKNMKPPDNSTDKYVRIQAQFGQWNQFWDASVLTTYTNKFGTPPNGTAITKVTTYVIGTTYWDVEGEIVLGNFVRACFDSDEAAGGIQATPIEWTYMVYLDGDNNLDSAALEDFNEMEIAGSTDKVNILVQSDGLWGYHLPSTTRRYYVTKDNDTTDIHSIMLQDMGELNMGDPTTLSDFITWAVLEYPARHYALVLWDHGQAPWAWRVCQDYTSNSDWLTMSELKTALNTALSNTDVILDIMGFDACLMQMTEVGYQIKDYVNIMVGSEELEHVSGWPYHTILGNLTVSPTMNATILAKTTVDCFGDSGEPDWSTLSAVNLTYMDDLAYWVDQLAQHLRDRLEQRKTIREVRDETQYYDIGEAVDLYDFSFRLAERYGEDGIDDTILFDVSRIMECVNASVIVEYHTPDRPGSHGLSIYFPDSYYQLSYGDLATYDFASYHWDEFLLDYVGTVGTSVAFSDDMENGIDGWNFSGNWHQTTERSLSPIHSWWTDIGQGRGERLISPNISIPQSSHVELKIGSWTSIHDVGVLKILVAEGGAPATFIAAITWYSCPQQEWLHYSFDISQYANKTIQIEFENYGRPEGQDGGWYVDDMSVTYQPAWDLLDESWDSLGDWTWLGGISEISPPGQLHNKEISGLTAGRYKYLYIDTLFQYTIEFRFKIDDFGENAKVLHRVLDKERVVEFMVYQTSIQIAINPWGTSSFSINTSTGVFYTWRLVVDTQENYVDVYRDGSYITRFLDPKDNPFDKWVLISSIGRFGEMHEDYFKIASGLHPPKACMHDWSYRKSHVINSASGAGTNYQIKLVAHYGNGTDSGEDVYMNNHSRVDFGDVRFTDGSDTAELDYWMEEKVDGDYAVFWVEVANDLSSNQTIYIYYGNDEATTTSNGANTFLFFDDCEDLSRWTEDYSSGTPIFEQTTIDGYSVIRLQTNAHEERIYIKSTTTVPRAKAIVSRIKHISFNSDSYHRFRLHWVNSTNWIDYHDYESYYDRYQLRKRVGSHTIVDTYSVAHPSGWFTYEVYDDGTNTDVNRDTTDILDGVISDAALDSDGYLYIMNYQYNESGTSELAIDNIFVRNYVDPEPSHGSWGSEECM